MQDFIVCSARSEDIGEGRLKFTKKIGETQHERNSRTSGQASKADDRSPSDYCNNRSKEARWTSSDGREVDGEAQRDLKEVGSEVFEPWRNGLGQCRPKGSKKMYLFRSGENEFREIASGGEHIQRANPKLIGFYDA